MPYRVLLGQFPAWSCHVPPLLLPQGKARTTQSFQNSLSPGISGSISQHSLKPETMCLFLKWEPSWVIWLPEPPGQRGTPLALALHLIPVSVPALSPRLCLPTRVA